MITLFNQNKNYYNQNNKILHLVSHMALQGAVLSATRELLNSVSRRSDRRVQLLTVGNFEKI